MDEILKRIEENPSLLKKVLAVAKNTIECFDSGTYQKKFQEKVDEITNRYSDPDEIQAKEGALLILNQDRLEDEMKYIKAKAILENFNNK